MKDHLKSFFVGAALFMLIAPVSAKITLPAFFTDNMVVQQNSMLTLEGKAKPQRTVTVVASWNKQKYTVKSQADGSFRLEIPTPVAGGPYTLTLSDGEKLILDNVMSGEVWFCSGQSNMQMPVAQWGGVMNYEQETAEAQYPSIRLLQIERRIGYTPATDVEIIGGSWKECSPITVADFSAVAYFYARELWKNLNVPIGVIDCTWGGTPAESWTSAGTLKQVAEFREKLTEMEALGFDKERLMAAYQKEMQAWEREFMNRDAGYGEGQPLWISSLQTGDGWQPMQLPGFWERNGLDGFDGVVWFQREIEIPAAWQGKEVRLSLGKIDDEDITYYNGQEIARGQGHATPRSYMIPANEVKAGKGVLTIRVTDYGGEGGINGAPEDLYAEVGGERISLAGKWIYRIGMSVTDIPAKPVSPESSHYPSGLYNAMVSPLTAFPVKGVIWYQGEENASRAEQYAPLFRALIADWRKQWKIDLPFYFVQLAGYMTPQEVQPDSRWAVLREVQAEALHIANTGMITAVDLGDPYDIHPKNKQEVGRRLALAARAQTYGEKIPYSGPIYKSYKIEGNKIRIFFDHIDGGLKTANGEMPKGFTIAGVDHKFHWADAVIEGNTVVVSSSEVTLPVAVRYAWADYPICNMYNGAPMSPFRTDDWKGITYVNK